MKLPIISENKQKNQQGFLIPEIMIAFSLMTLFLSSALILSATMQGLQRQAISHLQKLEFSVNNISSSTLQTISPYGNDTSEIKVEPLTNSLSDYANAWGRDTCDPRLVFHPENISLYDQGIDLGINNISTDIEVRNGIAYITADSATASAPDFYIIDIQDPTYPIILSSLNTGPGLASLEVAGHYVYAANTGSTHQLEIIDITNRFSPVLLNTLKLPLPTASTTAPAASTIFYNKGRVYIGTQKWQGDEFAVIDVTNPASPQYLGGFETNTLINDIYIRGTTAFVAASDIGQMLVLDIHDPNHIVQVDSFSASGWETQVGNILSYFEDILALGRPTGGFNVTTNHEIFTFSSTTPTILKNSRDIPGGVYGIILRPNRIYVASRSPGHEFQVWNTDLSTLFFEKPLGFQPKAISCDGQNFYFATGNQKGIAVLVNKK